MVYGYLPEGTRVSVNNMFDIKFNGKIVQCLYSAGFKGIGSGYVYFIKRDGEMFRDDNGGYKDYEVTLISEMKNQ